jgi:tetratricopeptide (TPR) repeat protein
MALQHHVVFSSTGKLYAQFGLIYSSMGLYDLGIQNFERALPLVRESVETNTSLQAEASLLQNIGAAYNEKEQYLEATVFHKEAAAIHGEWVGVYSLCALTRKVCCD